MSIAVRLEKLLFMVEEMQVAAAMATATADGFAARTLIRHVLIRAENFIEHARALRKPLNTAGFNTIDFNTRKEAYAKEFEEYFKLARHRLGAHVQDFDFGKRIELWNEIETIKVSYFVDGALEIYDALSALSLPGYVAYAPPPELSDAGLAKAVNTALPAPDSSNSIELGADSLALTRNGTIGMINTTPLHARAAQLALIRRWMSLQRVLLQAISTRKLATRLLRARALTDIVSFCDCLVTRPVAAGAFQAMDGLDQLVSAIGVAPDAITAFVTNATFATQLGGIRAVRDKIGAHVESSETVTLGAVLASLDGFDVERALTFFAQLEAIFIKTCSAHIALRTYAIDGSRIYGATSAGAPAVPYSGSAPAGPQAAPPRVQVDDPLELNRQLTIWLDGSADEQECARHFFYEAFAHSRAIETVIEKVESGSGWRRESHEMREAHRFVLDVLASGLSAQDFLGVLDLMVRCGNGWPFALAETIIRYAPDASILERIALCAALGEIASAPHQPVRAFLEDASASANWELSLQARIALFKTFIKHEGVFRLNNPGRTGEDYDVVAAGLLAGLNDHRRLIAQLAFASVMSGPRFGGFTPRLRNEYGALQAEIAAACAPFAPVADHMGWGKKLTLLIGAHDFVGIAAHVAASLDVQDAARAELLAAVLTSAIAMSGRDRSLCNFGVAHALHGDFRQAYAIFSAVAARNPDWTDVQIDAVDILSQIPGAGAEVKAVAARLRANYTLSAELEARLASIERRS